MLIAGRWQTSTEQQEVLSPFSADVVDLMPVASPEQVTAAVGAAVEGAGQMRATPAYQRAEHLERLAAVVAGHTDELALTITREEGKPLRESRLEASRVATVFRLSAQEALRLTGEVLPLDAAANGVDRLGFTLREPCGVVAAITPFNYPASLVALKLGPALAAGNAVIVKPPADTPLAALLLARYAQEAGLPPLAFQVVCGPGRRVGSALCGDPRVRMISFTGSNEVAEQITRVAGPKRMSLELGSNAALVVLADADIPAAARGSVQDGFVNAGQVCISAQRLIVDRAVREEFLDALVSEVDNLRPGDPTLEGTTLGPVISPKEAERIVGWVRDARDSGASVVRGGDTDRALVAPTVVVDPPADGRLWRDEVFGPVVAVRFVDGADEALAVANDTRYGLASGVFTSDLGNALRFTRGLRTGVVHVNHGPNWKSDFMPYGGIGASGFGKEGIRYATEEMTEVKTVIVHPTERA